MESGSLDTASQLSLLDQGETFLILPIKLFMGKQLVPILCKISFLSTVQSYVRTANPASFDPLFLGERGRSETEDDGSQKIYHLTLLKVTPV